MNASKKKLVLNRETVRALQGSEASRVAGGMPIVLRALPVKIDGEVVTGPPCFPPCPSSSTGLDAVDWAQADIAVGQATQGQLQGSLG